MQDLVGKRIVSLLMPGNAGTIVKFLPKNKVHNDGYLIKLDTPIPTPFGDVLCRGEFEIEKDN